MKYQVGDKITIKPIEWYNQHRDHSSGDIRSKDFKGYFSFGMSSYCGKEATIEHVWNGMYTTSFGQFPIYEWMIDMYTTDKKLYALRHGLPEPVIDYQKVILINMPMDSNDKFTDIELDQDEVAQEILDQYEVKIAFKDEDKISDRVIDYELKQFKAVTDPKTIGEGSISKKFEKMNEIATEISKATGKPKRKYTKKDTEFWNKVEVNKTEKKNKVSKSIKPPKGTKKLEFGTKVIAYNSKNTSEFQIGRYEGSDRDGYLVRLSARKVEKFKYIKAYSEANLKDMISRVFNETDQTAVEFNKLNNEIRKLISKFEDKFKVVVKWSLNKYEKI